MADAKQVQIRRDTAANLATTTPVEAELGYDQTNKRLLVGDGSTLGGTPHGNYIDIRTSAFHRGTVGGTGNAITLALSPAAGSYQTGLKIGFIAGSSNTGSVTINVNGLGNRTLQKLSAGTLVNLVSGDLVAGVYYEAVYSGSIFQVTTIYGAGIVSVSQGDLNTSGGTVTTSSSTFVTLTMPGGQYGFYPQTRATASSGNTAYAAVIAENTGISTSYATRIALRIVPAGSVSSPLAAAFQRYVTSSPPFDLGEGEVAGFFFAVVNESGDIISTYLADVPPWAYNGPTDIKATYKCSVTGKKFKEVPKKRSLEQIMDGAPVELKLEEITHALKNKDMGLIPHPFGDLPSGHHVVLLDTMDDKIRRLCDFQNAGGSEEIMDYIKNGKFEIGDSCKRKCPNGVHSHKLKYKYAKKF